MIWRAKRLPEQPGPAAWNVLLPEQGTAFELEGALRADVAIIGAGFAGLSAARRLSQIDPALKVVVLEAGRVAEGPAGRNSGFMIDLPHDLASDSYAGQAAEADRLQTHLNRHAIRFATDAAAEAGMGRDVFDPCGKINAAATAQGDAHNRAYGAHLAQLNESYHLMDAAEMAALTGTEYYTSGLFTPGTVMIQPAAYIRGLAGGLAHNVSLFEQSPVTEIERSGADWTLRTPKGRVTAPRVIMAANGHAESFGFFKRRLMHVFTYASMTDPLPEGALGGKPSWSVTPADPMGTTVRRIGGASGGRIVVRSRFTYNPTMSVSEGAVKRAGRLHDVKFNERFPMLRGTQMAHRWAGQLCLSWNGVAAHGEIEPGLFSAVCQNGLGTVKGTLAGISAAELSQGISSAVTQDMCAADAPRKLPPEPLSYLGANGVMRWKEWRSGRE